MAIKEIREAIYSTLSTADIKVTNNILEKGTYILVNSIDTDYQSVNTIDTQINEYRIYLELRSFSNSTDDIDELEEHINTNINSLHLNLKEKGLKTQLLQIVSSADSNALEENLFSKIITIRLILKA